MRWNRSATALILVSAWPAIAKPQELRAGANVALSYSVDADVEDCPGAGAMLVMSPRLVSPFEGWSPIWFTTRPRSLALGAP